jgi:hypothetical protein
MAQNRKRAKGNGFLLTVQTRIQGQAHGSQSVKVLKFKKRIKISPYFKKPPK